jgi:hypothetical protein
MNAEKADSQNIFTAEHAESAEINYLKNKIPTAAHFWVFTF